MCVCEVEVKVTGLARILLVFGLLVLVVALMVLWRDDRPANLEKSGASLEEPRVGRSTLSHGGPGVSGPPDAQGRPLKPVDNGPSGQPPQVIKR
ncbi:MAG: hypothetical protein ACXWWE_02050 [Nitrospira sp.]